MAKKQEIEQPEIRYTTGGIALTQKGFSLVVKHNVRFLSRLGNIPERIKKANEALARKQMEDASLNETPS